MLASTGSAGAIEVSLITCSPGAEVWSNYGHTALRVRDDATGADVTFNYGIFSFDTPNFIWRFCTGETDYMVAAAPTEYFIESYRLENRSVTEQVLDLDEGLKRQLFDALVLNCRPENRTYRYNYFYDNCATRVRVMIERFCGGEVDYSAFQAPYGSLRGVLDHYTAPYPWTRFGISLVIGSPADGPAPLLDQMFAPEIMMDAFASATVDGRPLVRATRVLSSRRPDEGGKGFPVPGPVLTMWLLFALVLAVSAAGYLRHRHFRGIEAALFFLTGLMGTVMGFLAVFSAHPATSPNFLLVWFNPLAFVPAAVFCVRNGRNKKAPRLCALGWLVMMAAGAVVFAVFSGGQYLHPAILPLLFATAVRCVSVLVGKAPRRG